MTAPLFFVDALPPAPCSVSLSVSDSRHAMRAMRLRRGEPVLLSDGLGMTGEGRLQGEQDGRAVVEVTSTARVVRRGTLVSVALAPPKGDRLAWAVQKLAEVGVDEALLMPTERSVRDWDPARAVRATARLRAVAREAAMQSRRPMAMTVDRRELRDVLAPGEATVVLLWEGAGVPLRAALPEHTSAVRLVVGPEGSFTDRELDQAREAGATPASLGPAILRTETAAVVGATLVLARYGRLD